MSEIELEIGEVLLIGEVTVTVVDIEGGDVSFKINRPGSGEEMSAAVSQEPFCEELESAPAGGALPR